MKKLTGALCAAALALAASCAGGPQTDGDAPVPLDEAIKITGKELAGIFPPGKRLALIRFETESAELSGYIMDELAKYLVRDSRLIVVERRNIESIRKELLLQESGMVSDETALVIGEMMGAEILIMGTMENTGTSYRWRVQALNVASGTHDASIILRVQKDLPSKAGRR